MNRIMLKWLSLLSHVRKLVFIRKTHTDKNYKEWKEGIYVNIQMFTIDNKNEFMQDVLIS